MSVKSDAVANWTDRLARQFKGLNPQDPASWPVLPRTLLALGVTVFVVGGLWFALLEDSKLQLESEQGKELKLREEYKEKLAKAVNLDALRKQREQVQQFVTQLEKQLPSKAEMDALLSDINQAGVGRSLQFQLFRPGQVAVREYYAELPIALRVTGTFHDIGAFTADVASLSRIVTLNNLSITPAPGGVLVLDTTAKTFRYLDPEEIAAQRKAAAPKGGKK